MTSLRITYPQVPEWKGFNKSESSIFRKLSEILKRFVFLNQSTLKGLRRYYLIDSPVPIVVQNGLEPFRHAFHLFFQRSPLVILAISSWYFARAVSGWTHVFPQASSLKHSRHFRLDSHRGLWWPVQSCDAIFCFPGGAETASMFRVVIFLQDPIGRIGSEHLRSRA